jgi:D-xylose transport system permease protein
MRKNLIVKFVKQNATLFALILIVLGLALADSAFFTPRNLSNLIRQVTIVGIISVGMTLVILIGGIDLSVGSVVGLSAIAVTMLMQYGLSASLAVPVTLVLVGGFVGIWNALWISYYKIPPFIITLGMLTIARGLALTLSGGSSIPISDPSFQVIGGGYVPQQTTLYVLAIAAVLYVAIEVRNLLRSRRFGGGFGQKDLSSLALAIPGFGLALYIFGLYEGLPVPVLVLAAIAGVANFVLSNTRFGRRLYAVGGNEEAARLSGVNIFRTKIIVYLLISVLSALAGIILASRLNGASPNLGTMFELDAIASVVIGGTSLSGGSGTIGGTIIGTLIIGVLNNGMSMLGISTFYQLVIKGVIITLAVWFDVLQKKR